VLSLKKIACLISFSFIVANVFAQQMDYSKEEPTDLMNSNGKIYVVMAVVTVIVLGLFLYLINLDRKIKKLEKDVKE
jgi:CcmD family protein